MNTARQWMGRALELAARATGRTSPNPCVGAVIVKNNRMIGEGFHRKAGGPHAEIEALRSAARAGKTVRGATLFVTLEPCSSWGRTPPCVDAIVEAGIKTVVVGAVDPNPKHAGRGLRLLRRAGIAVRSGVLREECAWLNRAFDFWIVTGRPWVIAKSAMSLDGRIVPSAKAGRWVTSEAARRRGHHLRLISDAIAVSGATVRADNPALTVRLGRAAAGKIQPWRVVLTRSGDLPPAASLFSDEFRERTLVFQNKAWGEVLADLGARGVTCLLIEGGGQLIASALRAGVVNEVAAFIAPRLLGGPVHAFPGADWLEPEWRIKSWRVESVGPDLFVQGVLDVVS